MMTEKDQINQITEKIIGAAITVHRALGPGLRISVGSPGQQYRHLLDQISRLFDAYSRGSVA